MDGPAAKVNFNGLIIVAELTVAHLNEANADHLFRNNCWKRSVTEDMGRSLG